jgi:hypothetical protein
LIDVFVANVDLDDDHTTAKKGKKESKAQSFWNEEQLDALESLIDDKLEPSEIKDRLRAKFPTLTAYVITSYLD